MNVRCGRCGAGRGIELTDQWAGGECEACGFEQEFRRVTTDDTIEVRQVEYY